MRCASYCIAESINLKDLVEHLVDLGLEPQYFDDVVHFKKQSSNKSENDVFCFPFGSIVIWNSLEYEEKAILEDIKKACTQITDDIYPDFILFSINDKIEKTYIDEEKNEIFLSSDSTFVKLSLSHAMAQSIKLYFLEDSVSKLLDRTKDIRYELAKKGSVSMSKKEISKQIGVLFNERYYINLHSDILDTPEFFWRRPSYEPLYLMTAEFLDIQTRHNILNHRLNMIHELYTILANELNYKHSTRLEIIIIILIAIEVIVALVHNDIFEKIYKFFF